VEKIASLLQKMYEINVNFTAIAITFSEKIGGITFVPPLA
jgi:hypothetical protein